MKKALVLLLLLVLFSHAFASNLTENYDFRRKITITAGADLNAGLTLDLNVSDFNVSLCIQDGNCQTMDLSDIRISDANRNELPRLIEEWLPEDANRIMWSLTEDMDSGKDLNFYIYYGNADESPPTFDLDLNHAPGWDYNYSGTGEALLVYHFEENVKDSTKNRKDGVDVNGIDYLCDTNAIFQCAGDFTRAGQDYIESRPIGDFGGDTTWLMCFTPTGSADTHTLAQVDTGSDIFQIKYFPSTNELAVGLKTTDAGGFIWFVDDAPGAIRYQRNCIALSMGSAGVFLFINGQTRTVQTPGSTKTIGDMAQAAQDLNLFIGARNVSASATDNFWDGQIDEFVILDHQLTTEQEVYKTFTDLNNVTQMFSVSIGEQESAFIAGQLRMQFLDENTLEVLPDVTVTFNETTFDANSDGFIDIDLNIISATTSYFVVSASDSNHSAREFGFDLNSSSIIDENVILLSTPKGRSIEFQFFGTDETTLLTDAEVTVTNLTADKLAYRKVLTNNQGKITLFINPDDANYQFNIVDDTETVNYLSAIVTVKPPKRESDKTTILPINFQIQLTGLAQRDVNNASGDVNFIVYANTSAFYNFAVDVNADFFERKYDIKLKGDTSLFILQPYLVSTSIGVSTKVLTQNIFDFSPIGGVEIQIFKFLSGEGRVLVETVVTDSKGEAFISGITNDNYEFEVFFNDVLISTPVITVTSTTITIQFNPTIYEGGKPKPLVSVVFVPGGGQLIASNETLTQLLTIRNGTLSSVRIFSQDANSNILYDRTFGAITSNVINIANDLNLWDENIQMVLTVRITLTDGNTIDFNDSYFAYRPFIVGNVVINILKEEIKADFGCSTNLNEACSPLVIITLILTLMMCGVIVTVTPLRDPLGVMAFSIIPISFFAYINWIPFFWAILFDLIIFVGLISIWRIR